MKVESVIKVYAIDGRTDLPLDEHIVIANDWIHEDRVRIRAGGSSYQVLAKDLRKAIDNATRNG